jgi:hypothetical protein
MDLGGWLRSLGLGKYELAFRENEIDETVLPSLTHETLKELGVTAVGHRLKLLDAIAALCTEASAPASPSGTPPEVNEAARDTAERRQVTVMFSDLVGSTALSARMDPEDFREVISAYQSCVAETVRRFGGGFVAKYIGDGVLSEIAASGQSPACRPIATLGALYAANSSSNALASFRSGVLKPSVNQS